MKLTPSRHSVRSTGWPLVLINFGKTNFLNWVINKLVNLNHHKTEIIAFSDDKSVEFGSLF